MPTQEKKNQSLRDFEVKIWPNTVPKLKSCQTYFKFYTLANLKVLITKLKLTFKIFLSKH